MFNLNLLCDCDITAGWQTDVARKWRDVERAFVTLRGCDASIAQSHLIVTDGRCQYCC